MSVLRLAPFALASVLLGSSPVAIAQEAVTVYSARADSVAVTIYPDDLALITETRTVQLPASAATLIVQDVADTLLPQSAVVSGLARPLAESNFDFNRLSPQSLLMQAVGQTVTLIRTNPATGAVTRMPATLRAAGEGVVLETGDGNEALYCAGLPEGIAFDAIPDDLYATPQLSMRLSAGDPGEQTIKLSYLAHGFEWNADYVGRFDAGSENMHLTGWATVTNASGRHFDQAELQLVAGQLNVLAEGEGGSRAEPVPAARGESSVDARQRLLEQSALADAMLLRECFAADLPSLEVQYRTFSASQIEQVIVTGARLRREEFGDYHLYRLPWLTDLGARQTKQVRFLELDDVTVERFYTLYANGIYRPRVSALSFGPYMDEPNASVTAAAPLIMIRTQNTSRNGLGEPLPEGSIRLFEDLGDSSVFVGQSYIADRPVGAEIELETGYALDLLVDVDFRVSQGRRNLLDADYRVINDKGLPIDLEVRHFVAGETDLTVEETSERYELKDNYLVWQFVVPPGGETLSYRLSVLGR